MRGIDVSNWQAGLNLSTLDIDFAIAKATEGIGYRDPQFSRFADQAAKTGILFGFYHFARNNDPAAEARYFFEQTAHLSGKALPVLDYEVQNSNNRYWVEQFAREYKALTGIYPVLYCSASMCAQFKGSWVNGLPLWVAGYPYERESWTVDYCPYNVSPWASPIMWQFTSSLRLPGFNGRLDGNIAYINELEWELLQEGANMSKIDDMAKQINEIHAYLADDTDVTGRGKKGTMKTRINWIAAKQEQQTELLDLINAKLDMIGSTDIQEDAILKGIVKEIREMLKNMQIVV